MTAGGFSCRCCQRDLAREDFWFSTARGLEQFNHVGRILCDASSHAARRYGFAAHAGARSTGQKRGDNVDQPGVGADAPVRSCAASWRSQGRAIQLCVGSGANQASVMCSIQCPTLPDSGGQILRRSLTFAAVGGILRASRRCAVRRAHTAIKPAVDARRP